MTVPRSSWQEFCYTELVKRTTDFNSLMQKDDSESEPYTSRYAAAEIQAKLIGHIRSFSDHQNELVFEVDGYRLMYATILGFCLIRRGLALSETDLLKDSLPLLEEGLNLLDQESPCQDIVSKILALNTLGVSLCGLDRPKEAAQRLIDAESAFEEAALTSDSTKGSQVLLNLDTVNEMAAAPQLQKVHTQTLFYRAQVEQGLGNGPLATEYCGRTLARQAAAEGMPNVLIPAGLLKLMCTWM